MNHYQIKKVLNNNIVLCLEIETEQECVVLGKGIGFQKNVLAFADEEKIEKVYFKTSGRNIDQYMKLVLKCNEALVQAVEEIIAMLEEQFGQKYDEYIHIALLDHLNFSIYRYENDVTVNSIFLEEYSIMYAKEYAFAQKALSVINERMQINLPEAEVGFITLHVHTALGRGSISKSALHIQIINECIKFIENNIGKAIPKGSLERMRLVTHLKFALERVDKNMDLKNPILDTLKKEYKKTYQLAIKLSQFIYEEYGIKMLEGEMGYLTLHIQNIIIRLEKEDELCLKHYKK